MKRRRNIKPAILLPLLLVFVTLEMRGYAQEQQTTPVEDSQALPKPPPGTLATGSYQATEKEAPFFAKLAADERTTGDMFRDYAITGRKGKFIGWFGIVRGIEEDQAAKTTKLLIEHKYFDGLTDTHMMTVSFNGGGDFNALLSGTNLGIKELSLVKVYGTVQEETDSIPELKAEYVRQWDWGRFTFMEYGSQKGNKNWQKLNKAGDKIYKPFPDQKYYEDRLGKRKP